MIGMLLIQRIIWVLFFLFSLKLTVYGQVFYHQYVSDEVSDIHFYSLIQDDSRNLWLTSNEGVYVFDGMDFHLIPYSQAKGSLFNIQKDIHGALYANNLKGEIYRINKDSISLFYKHPTNYSCSTFEFAFDSDNQLIISGKETCVITEGSIDTVFHFKNSYAKKIGRIGDSLVFYGSKNKHLYYYVKGKIIDSISVDEDIHLSEEIQNFQPHIYQNQIFLISERYGTQYQWINQSWKLVKNQVDEPLRTQKILGLGDVSFFETKGLAIHDYKIDQKELENITFSNVLKDQSKGWWFTTFGKGLIHVPFHPINHQIKDIDLSQITCFDVSGEYKLFGDKSGAYMWSNSKEKVRGKLNETIYFVELFENKALINSTFVSLSDLKQKRFKLGNVKDAETLGDLYVIGCNEGVYLVDSDAGNNNQLNQWSKLESVLIPDSNRLFIPIGRTNKVKVIGQVIYANTINGCYKITKTGIQKITQDLSDIQKHGDKLFALKNQQLVVWDASINEFNPLTGKAKFSLKFIDTDDRILLQINHRIYEWEKGHLILKHEHPFKKSRLKLNKSNLYGLSQETVYQMPLVPKSSWLPINHIRFFYDSIESRGTEVVIPYSFKNIRLSWNYFQLVSEPEAIIEYRIREDLAWETIPKNKKELIFNALSSGHYNLELRKIDDFGNGNVFYSQRFTVNYPFWKTPVFYVLVALFVCLIITYFYFLRLKRLKQKLYIQNQLKSFQIKAIKSQMNPHFAFNALNSLQSLILTDDLRNANYYLVQFADLLRKTLHFSELKTIKIHEEIAFLTNYLELESLRFGKDFHYEINCDPEIDQYKQSIPPMILQPFVENAIKHGLLHKDGSKKLTISFFMKDELMICTIQDNGIGREEAKRYQQENNLSFSTKATIDKAKAIQDLFRHHVSIKITDVNQDEEKGTIVTIAILPFTN